MTSKLISYQVLVAAFLPQQHTDSVDASWKFPKTRITRLTNELSENADWFLPLSLSALIGYYTESSHDVCLLSSNAVLSVSVWNG